MIDTESEYDELEYDHESVYEAPASPGAPVDPADEHRTLYATVVRRPDVGRPIVPAALRDRTQRRALSRWALRYGGHTLAYHLTRSPKYVAKVAVWAPVGVVRGGWRLYWWASAEEGNWSLRQHAASKNDADTWAKLDNIRRKSASWRWWVVGAGVLVALVAYVLLRTVAPMWARWLAGAAAVAVLARLGRPADKPIIDRVHNGPTYRKLTAELVRRMVLACRIPAIKEPEALTFPQEIHRDGPGYLAVVDLPYGVEATEVIERRGRLASGLRLPMDQVWPAVDEAHTGRLRIWVGDEPASAMRQPAWPLLDRQARCDVFRPFAMFTDPQLRTVDAEMMFRNWLFGGVPGSGKTFSMRVAILASSLDPRAELRGYELKGTGDYDVLEPVCVEYGSGADDATAEAAYNLLVYLRQECETRAALIKRYAKAGHAPENKVTPALASMPGSGLHPLVAFIDEAQELFTHPDFGKGAHDLAPKIVKLGRALGIILMVGTQRPDKDSLPPALTANVNTRFCLAVMDQIANDMILGTSMYKAGHRATVFEAGPRDAGWGIAVGLGKPRALRTFYVDTPAAKRVVERALELRGGPAERVDSQPVRATAYNLLADVRAVWLDGQDALWSELIVPRLQALRPDVYGEWTVRTFGEAMRAAGVPVSSVHRKIGGVGVTRYGVRLAQLTEALDALAERRKLAS